jgi:hypothetical protein
MKIRKLNISGECVLTMLRGSKLNLLSFQGLLIACTFASTKTQQHVDSQPYHRPYVLRTGNEYLQFFGK